MPKYSIPFCYTDSASSDIVKHVFEGLLDLDENLNLRGRMASEWTLTEKAYLLVDTQNRFPDGQQVTGARLMTRIKQALSQGLLPKVEQHLVDLVLLPPTQRTQSLSVETEDKERGAIEREHPSYDQGPSTN